MQKNKTALKGKACQPVNHACPKKTAKVCRQKSAQKARSRKPLTPEQRERKNARDRQRRAMLKRNVEDRIPMPVMPLMAEPSHDGHVGCRGKNACARCYRRKDCQRLADPTRVPKLHAVSADQAMANEKARREKNHGYSRLFRDIDCFIYDTVSKMANENRNGIVRRHFDLPDGVAEVSVCRKVCEVPQVAKDIAGIADRSWSALAESCIGLLFGRCGASQLELDVSRIVDAQHETGCTWFGDCAK